MLDLAIVGAGPCGLGTAVAAKRAGLRYRVFDKGGVVASLERVPYHIAFGSTPEKLEIAGVPFITQGARPNRHELLTYYRTVADRLQLELAPYTEVTDIDRLGGDTAAAEASGETRFRLHLRGTLSGRETREDARAVVIATGYFDHPNLLNVPGEDLPKVSHYFTHGHPYYGLDVAVVGGQNSAVEAALELWRSGARVTIVHRGPDLSPKVKPWVMPDIRARLEKGEIRAVFGAEVRRIEPDHLRLALGGEGGEEVSLPNDFVFALTGYYGAAPLLARLGVGRERDTGIPRHDPETMRTDVPGVYVAGVVAAGYDANRIFIENGRFHGERIVSDVVTSVTSYIRT